MICKLCANFFDRKCIRDKYPVNDKCMDFNFKERTSELLSIYDGD